MEQTTMWYICLLCTASVLAQNEVIPQQYTISGAEIAAINGSSATGNCSNVTDNGLTCQDPVSSVAFDGTVPTLTGLDGDMWASQLLTLRIIPTLQSIRLDFSIEADDGSMQQVEIFLFNCPQWDIAIDSLAVAERGSDAGFLTGAAVPTSCDSLVSVVVPFESNSTAITLTFGYRLFPNSTWLHLAEVSFRNIPTPSEPTPSDGRTELTTTDSNTTAMAAESRTFYIIIIVVAVVAACVVAITLCVVITVLCICGCKQYKNSKTVSSENHAGTKDESMLTSYSKAVDVNQQDQSKVSSKKTFYLSKKPQTNYFPANGSVEIAFDL